MPIAWEPCPGNSHAIVIDDSVIINGGSIIPRFAGVF
jgi:hypothetical protein